MSYESKINEEIEKEGSLPSKLDISVIKYFWQASPFTSNRKDYIPKFLRRIEVLKHFTDNELRIFAKYLHKRSFETTETIFKQGDKGVGFYIIYSGHVEVIASNEYAQEVGDFNLNASKHILSLEKRDYFGELALLQENNIRTATVVAKSSCELLGIFKPDLENLIEDDPIVAARLLQAISIIIADRFYSVSQEVGRLKYKIMQMENK